MSYLTKHRVVHQLEEILPLKGLGGGVYHYKQTSL